MLEPAAHLAPQPETSQYKGQSQGSVKVLDFGLARAIWGPAGNQDLSQLAGLTAVDSVAGQIVGTPGYISREQAPGKYADKRAHIWAFGCVLYELLTGMRALPSETLQDTICGVWNASQSGRPCLRKLRRESANCWAGVFERMRDVTSSQECRTTDLTPVLRIACRTLA